MADGFMTYALTGQVKFCKDYPPTASKPYGSLGFVVQTEPEVYTYIGSDNQEYRQVINNNGLFIWANYKPEQVKDANFNKLKVRLTKGMNVFVRGDIKPKTNRETGESELSLDCHWRTIKVSADPLPILNKVTAAGEVVQWDPAILQVRYSYMNPLKKEWLDRSWAFVLPGYHTPEERQAPRTPIYVEGRVFGITDTGVKRVWVAADTVI